MYSRKINLYDGRVLLENDTTEQISIIETYVFDSRTTEKSRAINRDAIVKELENRYPYPPAREFLTWLVLNNINVSGSSVAIDSFQTVPWTRANSKGLGLHSPVEFGYYLADTRHALNDNGGIPSNVYRFNLGQWFYRQRCITSVASAMSVTVEHVFVRKHSAL